VVVGRRREPEPPPAPRRYPVGSSDDVVAVDLDAPLVHRLRMEVAVLRARLAAVETIAGERQERIADLRQVLRYLPVPSAPASEPRPLGPPGVSEVRMGEDGMGSVFVAATETVEGIWTPGAGQHSGPVGSDGEPAGAGEPGVGSEPTVRGTRVARHARRSRWGRRRRSEIADT
jgi:hypothetical protein